jgi:glycosyltransferase involved in cell wall biosynthesis
MRPVVEYAVRGVSAEPGALVITSPFHTALARCFRRVPRYYHVVDDYDHYEQWDHAFIDRAERCITAHVAGVVVVSERLRSRYHERFHVPLERIHVVPNGVPASFIPDRCPARPAAAPAPIPAGFRPLAGILGRVTRRVHLEWVVECVNALPWLHVAFVGGVDPEGPPEYRRSLARLREHPRCCFTGQVAYEDLQRYAASLDVALLPFSPGGINPASSPVRMFTHLPFGAPLLATPSCDQFAAFEPLVSCHRTLPELVAALDRLRAVDFDDGLRESRWRLAHEHTWEARGAALFDLLCCPTRSAADLGGTAPDHERIPPPARRGQ